MNLEEILESPTLCVWAGLECTDREFERWGEQIVDVLVSSPLNCYEAGRGFNKKEIKRSKNIRKYWGGETFRKAPSQHLGKIVPCGWPAERFNKHANKIVEGIVKGTTKNYRGDTIGSCIRAWPLSRLKRYREGLGAGITRYSKECYYAWKNSPKDRRELFQDYLLEGILRSSLCSSWAGKEWDDDDFALWGAELAQATAKSPSQCVYALNNWRLGRDNTHRDILLRGVMKNDNAMKKISWKHDERLAELASEEWPKSTKKFFDKLGEREKRAFYHKVRRNPSLAELLPKDYQGMYKVYKFAAAHAEEYNYDSGDKFFRAALEFPAMRALSTRDLAILGSLDKSVGWNGDGFKQWLTASLSEKNPSARIKEMNSYLSQVDDQHGFWTMSADISWQLLATLSPVDMQVAAKAYMTQYNERSTSSFCRENLSLFCEELKMSLEQGKGAEFVGNLKHYEEKLSDHDERKLWIFARITSLSQLTSLPYSLYSGFERFYASIREHTKYPDDRLLEQQLITSFKQNLEPKQFEEWVGAIKQYHSIMEEEGKNFWMLCSRTSIDDITRIPVDGFDQVTQAFEFAKHYEKKDAFIQGLKESIEEGTVLKWSQSIIQYFRNQTKGGHNYRMLGEVA